MLVNISENLGDIRDVRFSPKRTFRHPKSGKTKVRFRPEAVMPRLNPFHAIVPEAS